MPKNAKCGYPECQLPKNNNRYIGQVIYIVIGVLVLCFRSKDFTFFQTFLFTAPILLDVAYAGADTFAMKLIRVAFGVLNTLILMLCILGFADIVKDTGATFKLTSEVLSIINGVEIKKEHLGYLLLANVALPIIYCKSAPSVKQKNALLLAQKIEREVAQ